MLIIQALYIHKSCGANDMSHNLCTTRQKVMRFMAAFLKLWYFLTFMANIAVKNLQIAIFI